MADVLLKNVNEEAIRERLTMDNITHYISHAILIVFVWCTLYGINKEAAQPINGHIFQVLAIFSLSYMMGEVMNFFNLPPLLGMLFTGFLVGNIFDLNLDKWWTATLRQTALVIILLRAGLELNPHKILRLSGVCFRLSFGPCIVESTTIAITSHFLLGLPWAWAYLMGFVLAAVSPAVVVSGVLPLAEKGYGVEKGVPTILMAASSVDDILAISGVMICLRLVFDSNSPLIWILVKGPIEALIGVMSGILIGLIQWYVPLQREKYERETEDMARESHKERFLLLFMSAIAVKYSTNVIDIESAGPLNSLVSAFTSALEWRSHRLLKPIKTYLKVLWIVFQPLLFGLIGTEVRIEALQSSSVGTALVCLTIALVVRCLTAGLMLFGSGLDINEKLFVALAWTPKATVQAALSPMALDIVRARNDMENEARAKLVLTIAVLAIMITAPLGAIAIALTGPKLLHKAEYSETASLRKMADDDDDDEDEDD